MKKLSMLTLAIGLLLPGSASLADSAQLLNQVDKLEKIKNLLATVPQTIEKLPQMQLLVKEQLPQVKQLVQEQQRLLENEQIQSELPQLRNDLNQLRNDLNQLQEHPLLLQKSLLQKLVDKQQQLLRQQLQALQQAAEAKRIKEAAQATQKAQTAQAAKALGYAKSLADLPAGTMVNLVSMKDNAPKYMYVNKNIYLRPGDTATALKIVRDNSPNVGFEAPNGNRLQSSKKDNNYVVSFANKNFGPLEKFTLEFDTSDPTIVWIKNNNTGGYLSVGPTGAVSTGVGQLAGKGPWEKFRIEIQQLIAAPAPQAASAPQAPAYAKSLVNLPAGTMVKLKSMKNANATGYLVVSDKFLKIDAVGTPLKIIRDATTDVGFEAPNGNRLQSSKEGNNCVVSFANKNFGAWEKFTLEFDTSDPTIVWIKNNNTGGYLSVGNDGNVSTGMGQLAGKGPWEKFRIEIVK